MSKLKLSTFSLMSSYFKMHQQMGKNVPKMSRSIYMGVAFLLVASIVLLMMSRSFYASHDPVVPPTDVAQRGQRLDPVPQESPSEPAVALAPRIEVAVEESAQEINKIKGTIAVDFGWQLHPVYRDWRYHTGIDINGVAGQKVEALYSGQVSNIFVDPACGLTVIVTNPTYSVYYGALSDTLVSKGSQIKAGQKIGTMGSCDTESYNHLHLAIKKGDQYIDPKSIITIE